MRIIKVGGTWLLQVLVGGLFILIGVLKFRDPNWARMFARWGYPDGFYMVIGVLEALAGVAVLVPRTARYGAVLIMIIMAAAAITHATHNEMQRFMAPVMYLLLAGAVAWLRRRGDITVAA